MSVEPSQNDLEAALLRADGHLESFGFHPRRSGYDHLRVLCRAIGADARQPGRLLRRVGLEAVAGRAAGTYSTGMRQRLAIACALVTDVTGRSPR